MISMSNDNWLVHSRYGGTARDHLVRVARRAQERAAAATRFELTQHSPEQLADQFLQGTGEVPVLDLEGVRDGGVDTITLQGRDYPRRAIDGSCEYSAASLAVPFTGDGDVFRRGSASGGLSHGIRGIVRTRELVITRPHDEADELEDDVDALVKFLDAERAALDNWRRAQRTELVRILTDRKRVLDTSAEKSSTVAERIRARANGE
jgi:hypothetical protein